MTRQHITYFVTLFIFSPSCTTTSFNSPIPDDGCGCIWWCGNNGDGAIESPSELVANEICRYMKWDDVCVVYIDPCFCAYVVCVYHIS